MNSPSKIKNIHDLLNQFREMAENNRDLGTKFELLMKSYFEIDPIYKDKFKKVSMWSDWDYSENSDNGIDLVAEGHDGEFTAIQCKFYSPMTEIKKENIDSFFTESGKAFKVDGKKKTFKGKIIVCTSDNWSKPAEDAIKKQSVATQRIRVQDLDDSPIDWSKFSLEKPDKLSLREKKKLRKHQAEAIGDVLKGFKSHERGKLIMACGTGKTFTALKLVEQYTSKDGVILFLVPSISLLSQTLREWSAESETGFHAFAICSDKKAGKDSEDTSIHDLAIPATTDTNSLVEAYKKLDGKKRTIIFSTYQSIDVVSQAQKKGIPKFDLIICDEAHRTTGATNADKDDSTFVKVHDNKNIKAEKRLYMTATPRIFGDAVKSKAREAGAELFSMDDEALYGPEFHRLGFGKAVSEQLLTDYKVLVLAVDERIVSPKFQQQFANEDKELNLEDIARIIGCWNGLSKKFIGEEAEVEDALPMKRAVAFASTIPYSKAIANMFQNVVTEYNSKNNSKGSLNCELRHVDGTFNVLLRNQRLDWLKAEPPENTCRILTNARCLSEGVDVPALDAVLFLNPRKSMVDVVQSVGRIMRRAEGKKYGYVILPIGIPAGIPPEEALKDNKKYEVVWQVLQALRAHDDRFDAEINQLELNKKKSKKIQVIGVGSGNESEDTGGDRPEPTQIAFNMPEVEDWKDAIYAKIVLKCGSRPYWENWAADVAKIAEKHTDHIKSLLKAKDSKPRKAFDKYLGGIRKNINPSISEDEAIEMLSQHLITKPVFDALFEHYPFSDKNPVSQSMQGVLKVLESGSFKEDAAKLKTFYDSVKMRVKGINNPEGRQKIIVELYDRFFKVAFPKISERLGIVYTPIEVVDFIINSVEAVLKDEFGQSLSDKGVHILDPFTGTGTFIVRLLQSGIIKPEDLKRKFQSELHANEIVLLAYYIAAINIEETYHGIIGGDYIPFEGVVLTDTFQLTEDEIQGSFESALPENSERVDKQKKTKINVIISNPPYSAGQSHENDNNKNFSYNKLDKLISNDYMSKSKNSMGKSKAYDSYVRGIKWASERIQYDGIICFISGGGFVEKPALDGMRASLSSEFSKIYLVNLRGDIRKEMLSKGRSKEGQNIFGSKCMTGIVISIFIRRKNNHKLTKTPADILYYDIGNSLSTIQKLNQLSSYGNVLAIKNWEIILPNKSNDWIGQRTEEFDKFIQIGSKEKNIYDKLFETYSIGVLTNRDSWTYGFSQVLLEKNVKSMISFYNSEVKRLVGKNSQQVEKLIDRSKDKIKWTSDILKDLTKGKLHIYYKNNISECLYRPFVKSWLYYNSDWNWSRHLVPQYFPTELHQNLVIYTSGIGARSGFSTIISNIIPDKQTIDNGQCFPLYYYEKADRVQSADLLKTHEKHDKHGYIKRVAITDFALEKFQKSYEDKKIKKEDIFYYVYGMLHSPTYREKYQNDLKKMLPRIPLLKDFWGYSNAGRALADVHLNYETIKPYKLVEELTKNAPKKEKELYRVNEAGMKFPKINGEEDKTTIIYNQHVTLKGIPLEAYDFVVNGKSALEWIKERYKISTDKDSGIKNDPNEWSDDPRYIVDLVKRIVTVSLETNKIVASLPKFELL